MSREQQHQLVGRDPCHFDSQRRVLGQVERLPKLTLCQHLQPEPTGLLGEPGQVMLGPAGPQIVIDHRIRITGAVG